MSVAIWREKKESFPQVKCVCWRLVAVGPVRLGEHGV
jgi:hypothetical protein